MGVSLVSLTPSRYGCWAEGNIPVAQLHGQRTRFDETVLQSAPSLQLHRPLEHLLLRCSQ
jgi:hypothetical protein